MRTALAFLTMLGLAAIAAVAVLRMSPIRRDTRPAPAATSELILTGHPATFSLAHDIARGTAFEIQPAWPEGLPWNEQDEFARQNKQAWRADLARVSAVITLRHAAPDDALYASVKNANPRVVELDASVDGDQRTSSIRLRNSRDAGASFALSLTNAARLAERIAADLSALHPDDAPKIVENLRAAKERLLRLKARHDRIFAEVERPEVIAFSEHFNYLCEEFGIQIVARLDGDPKRWAINEETTIANSLKRLDSTVSIHAFPPSSAAERHLKDAGIKVVVLDPLTALTVAPQTYWERMEAMLISLHEGFGD